MPKDYKANKQFIKQSTIKSTQSSGLASRAIPLKGRVTATPHNNALEGHDIVQKGSVTYKDSRYK